MNWFQRLFRKRRKQEYTLPQIPHLRDVSKGNINTGEPSIPKSQVPPPPPARPATPYYQDHYTAPLPVAPPDNIFPFDPFRLQDLAGGFNTDTSTPDSNADSFGGNSSDSSSSHTSNYDSGSSDSFAGGGASGDF